MLKTILIFLMAACELMAGSGDLSLSSDRIYRGISTTDHSPSIKGRLAYDFDLGLTLESAISNIGADEARGSEVQTGIGYSQPLGTLFILKTGLDSYYRSSLVSSHSLDIYVKAIIQPYFQVCAFYMPEYFETKTPAWRGESQIHLPVSEQLSLNTTVGYNWFRKPLKVGFTSYVDYKIGIYGKQDEHQELGLFYTNTNRMIKDGVNPEKGAKDQSFVASYTLFIRG